MFRLLGELGTGFSLPVVMMVKESVNRAFESSLNECLLFERRAFHASFGLEDQKEGMAAFDQVFPQRGSVYFQAPAGSPCEAIEARCKSGSDLHRSQSALA